MIDGHTHMLQGQQRRRVEDIKEINLSELFDKMDEIGIGKIVTLTQEEMRVSKRWLGSNEITIDLQEKFPERVVGIIGGEPLDEKDRFNAKRLKEFRSAVLNHGIKGMCFTPPYGHFYANDKRAYPFYEAAVELDAVIYFHHAGGVGGGGGRAYQAPLKYARPILLDDVVIDFPDLRIHVEHMAYPWTEELFAIMKHAPNVYTDIDELFSRPTVLAWYLAMAKEYGVIDRVIWGSDYDVVDGWGTVPGYFRKVQNETTWVKRDLNKVLEKSGWPTLSNEEVNGILEGNVRKLLRLR